MIRPVWTKYFEWVDAVKASLGNYVDLVSLIKTQLQLLDLFFVISWLLWNRRNKIRVGDSVPPMDSIILEAEIFLALHKKNSNIRVKKIQRVVKSKEECTQAINRYMTRDGEQGSTQGTETERNWISPELL